MTGTANALECALSHYVTSVPGSWSRSASIKNTAKAKHDFHKSGSTSRQPAMVGGELPFALAGATPKTSERRPSLGNCPGKVVGGPRQTGCRAEYRRDAGHQLGEIKHLHNPDER